MQTVHGNCLEKIPKVYEDRTEVQEFEQKPLKFKISNVTPETNVKRNTSKGIFQEKVAKKYEWKAEKT